MNILQINTADKGGGAEGSAWNLFRRYQQLGHRACLAVGQKFSREGDVLEIPREAPPLGRPLMWLSNCLRPYNRRLRGMYMLTRALDRIATPRRLGQFLRGEDETCFPGCKRLADTLPWKPDIIHCHNLHGWYFDLNILPKLSSLAPVVLNLRDTWALTGHCAYFMDCQKWQYGCGNCPRLASYPRCRRDATAQNLRNKLELFKRARVNLVTPSQWLADEVAKSLLQAMPCRVIPNGIDTGIFQPGDRAEARQRLGLPQDRPVVMFAAAARTSEFKDASTLWTAAEMLSATRPDALFVCVGISRPARPVTADIRYAGYIADSNVLADYYRAADVFWHAAKAEAFGKTVTEAMACGTFVIASDVGGIPEQILPHVTGCLAGAPRDFSEQTLGVLAQNDEQRARASAAAARRGGDFSLERQADAFLKLYRELQEERLKTSTPTVS